MVMGSKEKMLRRAGEEAPRRLEALAMMAQLTFLGRRIHDPHTTCPLSPRLASSFSILFASIDYLLFLLLFFQI